MARRRDSPYQDPLDMAGGRPRRSRRRRVLIWLTAFVVVVAVLGTAGVLSTYRYLDHKIHRVSLSLGPASSRPPATVKGAETLLLVGSDSRAGGLFQGSGATAVSGQRSDTMILARLSSTGASLVSLPRDTWVTVPAYKDSAGVEHAAGKSKINAAFSEGGPSLLTKTVEKLTGVRVDHFVEVDFVGFEKMTAALGGVNVCLKAAPGGVNLSDTQSGFAGHVGTNHLAGANALAFVRQRYNLPGGDLDRIKRQQQFLSAVLHKATSTGILTDPVRLLKFLNAATSSLTTDTGTSATDLRRIATRLRGISTGNGVVYATIPTYAPAYQVDGQDVLLYTASAVRAQMRKLGFLGGGTVGPKPTATTATTPTTPTTPTAAVTAAPTTAATVTPTPTLTPTPATTAAGCTY